MTDDNWPSPLTPQQWLSLEKHIQKWFEKKPHLSMHRYDGNDICDTMCEIQFKVVKDDEND